MTVISDTQIPTSGPSETFVTEFDYDVLNRMTTRREIDRLNALNILTTTYEYDSRSNLTFRTDARTTPCAGRTTWRVASRSTSAHFRSGRRSTCSCSRSTRPSPTMQITG